MVFHNYFPHFFKKSWTRFYFHVFKSSYTNSKLELRKQPPEEHVYDMREHKSILWTTYKPLHFRNNGGNQEVYNTTNIHKNQRIRVSSGAQVLKVFLPKFQPFPPCCSPPLPAPLHCHSHSLILLTIQAWSFQHVQNTHEQDPVVIHFACLWEDVQNTHS